MDTAGTAGVRARTNGDRTPVATRSVTPSQVNPGGTASVTVTVPEASGRVVLRDEPSAGTTAIDAVSPDPIESVAANGQVYVLWEFDDGARAELEYSLSVPDRLRDGESVDFDGELLVPDYVVPVDGHDVVPVTTDVAGSILADGDVDERDLADAGRHLSTGTLSQASFERVYHAWLDAHASDDAESPETGASSTNGADTRSATTNGETPAGEAESDVPESHEQADGPRPVGDGRDDDD